MLAVKKHANPYKIEVCSLSEFTYIGDATSLKNHEIN